MEMAVGVTGHEVRTISAIWEYVDTHFPSLVFMSTGLSGWPFPPYGQHGPGSVPASLGPILRDGAVGEDGLGIIIDSVFGISSGSPSSLQQKGDLRPAVDAAFATVVMYSPERKELGEMKIVRDKILYAIKLQTTVKGTTSRTDTRSPDDILKQWAYDIRLEFTQANMVLSSRTQHTGQEQVAAHVQELGNHVGTLTDMLKTLSVTLSVQNQQIRDLQSQVAFLSGHSTDASSKLDFLVDSFKNLNLQGSPETASSTAATSNVGAVVVVANVSLLPVPLGLPAVAHCLLLSLLYDAVAPSPARSIGSN